LLRCLLSPQFFDRLWRLIQIVVPSPYCKEAGILVVLLGFLVARTFLSIKISEVNGSIVKAIVDRQFTTVSDNSCSWVQSRDYALFVKG